MAKDTDIAWAAGFIDGEGTFRYKTNQFNAVSLELSVGQIHKDVLLRLERVLDCGKVYGPYYKKQGQPIYTYILSKSNEVVRVYNLLSAYLSNPKLTQAQKCMSVYENRNLDGPGRKVGHVLKFCKFGHTITQHGVRRFCRTCANRRSREYYRRITSD